MNRMTGTVRFSAVTARCGAPQVYLPLVEPRRDRNFMRAVREGRVLSLKQEPTGTRKDFGVVGFLEEKYVSYLVFPESLDAFKGKRVVGIRYDSLKESSVMAPRAKIATARGRGTKPRPKPRPRPKRFTATVRLVSTGEVKVIVEAFDEEEARRKAAQAARAERSSPARVEADVLTLVSTAK